MLHVICARPGMIRGGRANPLHAAYENGEFTPAQLRDLVGDPNITVIAGGEVLTTDAVDAAEASAGEADGATKKAKGK